MFFLAPAIALGACAHQQPTAPVERVARLPIEDKAAVLAAQRNVNVAEQNLEADKVAVDEAKQFDEIAGGELDGAKSKLVAARRGIGLGQSAQAGHTVESAEEAARASERDVIASRAKKDYAERLIALREAQVDEAQSSIDLARANLELTKVEQLKANGMAGSIDERRFFEARDEAQRKLAPERMRVASLTTEVAQLRQAWDDRRHQASARASDIAPPPPPVRLPVQERTLAPPPAGEPPRDEKLPPTNP
jgi:hypothetical protein